MRKEEFLQELLCHLQALEDQEQQDICGEYAQHIDMKIQRGLSEEEAIRDFGPVKALAAGILEAYHVKPGAEAAITGRQGADLKRAAEGGKKAVVSAGGFLKRKACAVGRGIRRGFLWLAGKGRALGRRCQGLFRRTRTGREGRHREAAQPVKPEDMGAAPVCGGAMPVQREAPAKAGVGGSLRSLPFGCVCFLGRGLRALWLWFWDLLARLFWLCWNSFWILAGLVMGLLALVFLFFFGGLLVLAFQDYPLVGSALIALGGTLSAGAFVCGCFTLLHRRAQGASLPGKPAQETKTREKAAQAGLLPEKEVGDE